MLTRKALLLSVILIIAPIVFLPAQSKETLAVLDFKTEAVSETEMNAIVEFLSAELFNTNKFIVIDVSQRQAILDEMEFSNSGCTDDSCALEIGKMLSAELIVTGNLSKVGTRYLMSVKLLETETSKTMGTANGKFGDLDELIDGLDQIAYTLSGMETTVKTTEAVTDASPEQEPEPPAEPGKAQTAAAETDKEAVKPAAEKPAASKPQKEQKPAEPGEFNVPSFILSAAGAGTLAASGVFGSLALVDRLAAEDAYDAYMKAVDNPGFLYSGDGEADYELLYNTYEHKIIAGYATGGAAGALTGTAFLIGDSYLSAGGKFAWAAGAFTLTAGNVLSVMASNNLINSRSIYEEYMSASALSAGPVYEEYIYLVESYQLLQYISYGLWGSGGLLTIGSWLIPGDRTPAVSGPLEKLIMAAGSLLISGGNFTSTMAVNTRFDAEDAYDDYMSASSASSASALFSEYEACRKTYEILTYTSYGLWGAGAAAVVTAMLLPPSGGKVAEANSYNFSIRPAMTGIGVTVDISLR